MNFQNLISLAFVIVLAFDGGTSLACNSLSCSSALNQVCGSDGKTYSNECELKTAQCLTPNLKINHDGACSTLNNNNIDNCSQFVCPALWKPVCGSDGKTYGNRCELRIGRCKNQHLTEEHPGSCEAKELKKVNEFRCEPRMKGGMCTKEYNPVCGNNGKTYSNLCMLCAVMYEGNNDLKVIKSGPCTEDKSYLNPGCNEQVLKIQCTQDEFPLCGTDGNTYGNSCKFCKGLYALKNEGVELNVRHLGYCNMEPLHDEPQIDIKCSPYEKNGFCSKIYVPVCGSDGKTYGNKCMLCFAMNRNQNLKFEYGGECRAIIAEVTTSRVINIQCPDNVKYCDKTYEPVCASDGTTLANDCVFCLYKKSRDKAGVQIDLSHGGECMPEEYCTPMSVFGACPYTYFPLCASDGKTYPNLCVMCAEMYKERANFAEYILRKVHDGVCGFEPPMYYEEGFCDEKMKSQICSAQEYSPYCASDGKTYKNKCLFCQEMYKQKEGGVSLYVNVVGECPGNFICSPESHLNNCPNTDEPVCGSDGVTYKNNCERCAEMYRRQKEGENIFIYVKYKGVCPK